MILEEDATHYDTLELSPDASPKEIREAYLRLKSAYGKDSVALYSLMSKDDTEETVRKIEAAYRVLSDPDKRAEYDRNHSIRTSSVNVDMDFFGSSNKRPAEKVIPSDRPIMDDHDLFNIPPVESSGSPVPGSGLSEGHESTSGMPPSGQSPSGTAGAAKAPQEPLPRDLDIEHESEWRGELLKKIREHQMVSVEEMADFTKITKRYIRAIEDEDYSQLPAAVYLRGFVAQIAKRMKLPHEKVASCYVERYRKACPDKN